KMTALCLEAIEILDSKEIPFNENCDEDLAMLCLVAAVGHLQPVWPEDAYVLANFLFKYFKTGIGRGG
ncbi:unnamed protein product, partial [marine sediment metagenome]